MTNPRKLFEPRPDRRVWVEYDADTFGRFAERIARYLGTARFLVFQTGVVAFWLAWNLLAPEALRFDPWSGRFVFLTLALSLQASYAAPLILLAQNRQEDRDRAQFEEDRRIATRTRADTDFLAREIASVRMTLADTISGEDLERHLTGIRESIEALKMAILDAELTGDSGPYGHH